MHFQDIKLHTNCEIYFFPRSLQLTLHPGCLSVSSRLRPFAWTSIYVCILWILCLQLNQNPRRERVEWKKLFAEIRSVLFRGILKCRQLGVENLCVWMMKFEHLQKHLLPTKNILQHTKTSVRSKNICKEHERNVLNALNKETLGTTP